MMDGDADHELHMHRHPVTGAAWPRWTGVTTPWRSARGGIVAVAEIIDCVEPHTSPWFVGRYGFVLRNACPLPFMPLKGQLGFFAAEYVAP